MTPPQGRIAGRRLLYLLKMLGLLSRQFGLLGFYYRFIERRVRECGLFDADWYLAHNPDVAESGMDALSHFVIYGDREGRSPLKLFDPRHYRSHSSPRCPKIVNSLLHYAWLGRYTGASTSPWFDSGYYLAQNRDVKYAKIDPLLHFIAYGWGEGRTPAENFDRIQFLRALPEFDPAAAAELVQVVLPHAELPSDSEWAALVPAEHPGPVVVDVIVPVYRGIEETLRCLYSVLARSQQVAFECIVINDSSPEPELSAALDRLAARGLFTYLRNESNEGFVRTVNRGMRLHPARDVVLLNADAQPFNDWLDRLRAAAYRGDRVASVTPLSNNATICSYPQFNRDNPFVLEIDGAAVDVLAAEVNAGIAVPAPTGVGFCMYIRRAALDAVGLFDEQAFGHGYGEENDFCQRAAHAGWQNLLAADTYVWHWGATSFGGSRHKRVLAAVEILMRRYPRYQRDVDAFIAADPLRSARTRLDEARLTRARSDAGNVLVVTHARGGGTERHIAEALERIRAEGKGVYFLRPGVAGHGLCSAPGLPALPNLPAIDVADAGSIGDLLRRLAITEVHVHQVVDFADGIRSGLQTALAARPDVRLEIVVHDYLAICPRINLVDAGGRYCGEPSAARCNACLAQPPSTGEGALAGDIVRWRARSRALFEAAGSVQVPDEDVARRLARHFPAARFRIVPHEHVPATPVFAAADDLPQRALKVVTVGAIGPIKGFDVLVACARDARARGLPLQFSVLGYTCADKVAQDAGVVVSGRYRDADLPAALAALEPDLVWLPSVWPETYCYTLTPALAAGLPVAAFDLGAIASRLRAAGRGDLLMPIDWVPDAVRINDRIMEFRATRLAGLAVPAAEVP